MNTIMKTKPMNNLQISVFFLVLSIVFTITVIVKNKPAIPETIIGTQVYFEGDTATVVDVNFVNTTFILANGKIIDAHQINKFIIKK